MNGPSLVKFENRVKKNGLLLLNQSLVNVRPERKDLKVIEAPFTEIASELGNIKCANTVALGTYLAVKKIASRDDISAVLNKMLSGLSQEIFTVNKRAKGASYGKS
jgi:2-oxoglutarate ferredoxin oxidoreductase subunit gamma